MRGDIGLEPDNYATLVTFSLLATFRHYVLDLMCQRHYDTRQLHNVATVCHATKNTGDKGPSHRYPYLEGSFTHPI